MKATLSMGCNRICIERNQNGFEVTVTDPKVVEANDKARQNDNYSWKDPEVEYQFATKQQVLDFIDASFDKALPEEEYSSVFDKLAKEAMGK